MKYKTYQQGRAILIERIHRAYLVTQECASNDAIAKTNNKINQKTKIFYSKSNLQK
jgi:hypothetical protein